jgi:putative spermidine/putrescine transport system permease protein
MTALTNRQHDARDYERTGRWFRNRLRRNNERAVPLVFWLGAVFAIGVLVIPVVVVVLAALNAGTYLTFPPQGFSLRWLGHFLSTPTFRGAYLFSLRLALTTAIIATLLGTCTALFLTRVGFRGRSIVRAYFMAPLMLPWLVLGLALYTFYVTTNIGFARTLPGLVVGHVIVTTPYVIGTVSAVLYAFDRSLEEAARSLGASPWTAFRKVTLPLIAPGVMAGAIFAFIVSFGQFEVSLFLSTPNLEPLPIALYASLRYQFDPTGAAAGLFAILVVITAMIISNRLISFRKLSGIRF